MTEEGLVLGTPTYMSPEQARGKPVDRRTDIWAFGCVLYECLTAKRAFRGETFSDVIASIMSSEPDGSALPAATPVSVTRLLRRCLDKDADRDESADREEHWTLLAHSKGVTQPRLSPTGEHVAFLRNGAIEVRALRSLQPRRLSGTEGALDVFWRPDGAELGFARNSPGGGFTLHKIAIEGGEAFDVTELAGPAVYLGGVWTIQDEFLFAVTGSDETTGLQAVSAAGGGPPLLVLAPDRGRGEFDFHNPRLLSDGFTVTIMLHPTDGQGAS
ncbi:MAG: hypothetical protein ACI8QZ_004282 [Chlamydiales bacterium]|jgi:hypothetical protein